MGLGVGIFVAALEHFTVQVYWYGSISVQFQLYCLVQ